MEFTCNVCGKHNASLEEFGREKQNCAECGATVRIRGLIYALSLELFGTALQLRDFPVLKGLRSLGMTDSDCYARILAEKFYYKNTFFDREPKLDITQIDPFGEGGFELLISSEVFEHVPPPLEKALENAFRLLAPNGILLLSIPYSLNDWPSVEHFPQLADAGIAHLRGGAVLVNRTVEGELQVFDNLIFHLDSGSGSALEMRNLNEAALRSALLAAGFKDLQFYGQDYPPFGVHYAGQWSLPVVARKQPFELPKALHTESMQQFGDLKEKLRWQQAEILRQQAVILRQRTETAALNQDPEARREWANSLEQELNELRPAIEGLKAEIEWRINWAHSLERELAQSNRLFAVTQGEVESRTKWAQDLNRQLEERTKWALELDAWAKELEKELAALRAKWWSRMGRRLRMLP